MMRPDRLSDVLRWCSEAEYPAAAAQRAARWSEAVLESAGHSFLSGLAPRRVAPLWLAVHGACIGFATGYACKARRAARADIERQQRVTL